MNRLLLVLLLLALSIVSLDAQWLDPTGPTGGAITALVSTRNGLYAGTSAGGVLRTLDGGDFWREVNQGGLVPEEVIAIAADDTALYVATDGGIEASEFGDVWFHDDNRGFGLNASRSIVSLQSVDWGTFAGTRIGLYRHIDGALSWDLMDSTRSMPHVRTLVPFGNRLLAGFAGRGVMISLDSGEQWRAPEAPIASGIEVVKLVVAGEMIVAGTSHGVLVSRDGGESWSVVASLPATARLPVVVGDVVVVSSDTLFYRSLDNGITWSAVSSVGLPAGLDRRELEEHEGAIYLGTGKGEGIFRSDDAGSTWRAVNRGVTNTVVDRLAVQGSLLLAAAGSDGGFASNDAGTTWRRFGPGETNNVVRGFFVHGDTIIAERYLESSSSIDGGRTWSEIGGETPLVGTMAILDEATVGISSRNLVRLNGERWEIVAPRPADKPVAMLAIGGILVLLTDDGEVFRSTDRGASWTASESEIDYYHATSLVRMGSDLYIGGTTNIYRSIDSGSTWKRLRIELYSSQVIHDLLVVDDRLFVATYQGVLVTADRGETFRSINENLSSEYIRSLAAVDGHLVAGTMGSGVFRRALSTVSSVRPRGMSRGGGIMVVRQENGLRVRGELPGMSACLRIIDLHGRTVHTEALESHGGTIDRLIDTPISTGAYLVEITADGARLSTLVSIVR